MTTTVPAPVREDDAENLPGTAPGPRPGTGAGAVPVCRYDDLEPERGVAALVAGTQVAIFRLHDGRVLAVDHHDPFSGANVIARGIVGTRTVPGRGELATVASPMYKQVFDLVSGECLDDPRVALGTHEVEVDADGTVRVTPREVPADPGGTP